MDTPGLGRSNPLGLAFADTLPLILCHKGQDLEHEIRDEGPHEVLAVAGIQQGHVHNADVNTEVYG